jgi:nucleoside-diphosphate-sugar epimerase
MRSKSDPAMNENNVRAVQRKSKDKKCTCLISGGAGFIGSHLTHRLLNEGYRVTVVDNFSSGRKEKLQDLLGNPALTVVKMDLKKRKCETQTPRSRVRTDFSFCGKPRSQNG